MYFNVKRLPRIFSKRKQSTVCFFKVVSGKSLTMQPMGTSLRKKESNVSFGNLRNFLLVFVLFPMQALFIGFVESFYSSCLAYTRYHGKS